MYDPGIPTGKDAEIAPTGKEAQMAYSFYMASESFGHARDLFRQAFLNLETDPERFQGGHMYMEEMRMKSLSMFDCFDNVLNAANQLCKVQEEEMQKFHKDFIEWNAIHIILRGVDIIDVSTRKNLNYDYMNPRRWGLIMFALGQSLTAVGWALIGIQNGLDYHLRQYEFELTGTEQDTERQGTESRFPDGFRSFYNARDLIREGTKSFRHQFYLHQDRKSGESVAVQEIVRGMSPLFDGIDINIDNPLFMGTESYIDIGDPFKRRSEFQDFLSYLYSIAKIHRSLHSIVERMLNHWEQNRMIFGLGQYYNFAAWYLLYSKQAYENISVPNSQLVPIQFRTMLVDTISVPFNNAVPIEFMSAAMKRMLMWDDNENTILQFGSLKVVVKVLRGACWCIKTGAASIKDQQLNVAVAVTDALDLISNSVVYMLEPIIEIKILRPVNWKLRCLFEAAQKIHVIGTMVHRALLVIMENQILGPKRTRIQFGLSRLHLALSGALLPPLFFNDLPLATDDVYLPNGLAGAEEGDQVYTTAWVVKITAAFQILVGALKSIKTGLDGIERAAESQTSERFSREVWQPPMTELVEHCNQSEKWADNMKESIGLIIGILEQPQLQPPHDILKLVRAINGLALAINRSSYAMEVCLEIIDWNQYYLGFNDWNQYHLGFDDVNPTYLRSRALSRIHFGLGKLHEAMGRLQKPIGTAIAEAAAATK